MKKLKIKKGDTVEVITGDDKGKTGNVLDLDQFDMKIRVSGCRIQTKRDRRENTLIKEEGWMDYSNVKLSGAKKTAAKKKSTKAKAKA
ncbi:MAG: KOW motif-containing protein [Bdellovibrionales bacterium]|nr:KOW motif-containing protein [Bdellovibrionales bacterium]